MYNCSLFAFVTFHYKYLTVKFIERVGRTVSHMMESIYTVTHGKAAARGFTPDASLERAARNKPDWIQTGSRATAISC